MDFKIKKRYGLSKIGELSIDKNTVITPNLLYINTARFKAPNFADIHLIKHKKINKPAFQFLTHFQYSKDVPKEIHLYIKKQFKKEIKNVCIIPANIEFIDNSIKNNPALLFVIANSYQLFQQPKKFLDFIVCLRKKIGNQKLLYLPSIGNPTNFALLVYLGIDFFDSISSILSARNDMLLFNNGSYDKNELNELPCNCPTCNKYKDKPSNMTFEMILSHNYNIMLNEIKLVRNAIIRGDLRDLVELRVKAHPNLTAILRDLDKNYYNILEKNTPITSNNKLLSVTKESHFRPEIIRFQKRVINQYKKPKSSKILLLLPCSAKKPYSFSKSHKLFKEKINDSGNPFLIHELIITSPMGIVPRELELVYPASNYDIPVTGVWDEDEKKIIRSLLKKYLAYNKYDKIIVHLSEDLMSFINDLLVKPVLTCVERPTSEKSLDKLSNTLKKSIRDYKKVKSQDRFIENFKCLASYQFGGDIAEKLTKDCIVKGKYPFQKLILNKSQLGMITKDRGFISLTNKGAEILMESNKFWVEIFDDFTLKGSVFAPGVKDADNEIRIGDEVVVKRGKKLIAVGVAQMNGDEMKKSSYGEVVKVRHRV